MLVRGTGLGLSRVLFHARATHFSKGHKAVRPQARRVKPWPVDSALLKRDFSGSTDHATMLWPECPIELPFDRRSIAMISKRRISFVQPVLLWMKIQQGLLPHLNFTSNSGSKLKSSLCSRRSTGLVISSPNSSSGNGRSASICLLPRPFCLTFPALAGRCGFRPSSACELQMVSALRSHLMLLFFACSSVGRHLLFRIRRIASGLTSNLAASTGVVNCSGY